jgi:hypothetical protein
MSTFFHTLAPRFGIQRYGVNSKISAEMPDQPNG